MRRVLLAAVVLTAITAGGIALWAGEDAGRRAGESGGRAELGGRTELGGRSEPGGRTEVPRRRAAGPRAHLRALQEIADAHDGTRAAGTPGDRASVRYVAGRLRAAGYRVRLQPVRFSFFDERRRPRVQRAGRRVAGVRTLQYSGSGDVRGRIAVVDAASPPRVAAGSTSGCERADFARFPRGRVALLQRGTCTLRRKVLNAQRAGAVAAVIFNDGRSGRTGALNGTLGDPGARIPALAASFAAGRSLAAGDAPVRIAVDAVSERRTTHNVLADAPRGDARRIVMAGGHLDSVAESPGLNDNGSGVAALLDLAEEIAARAGGTGADGDADDPARGSSAPHALLRFAFWGAEEIGLVGSRRYVRSLSRAARRRIAAYVNLDMVGSPNGARMVYDGDATPASVRGASRRVERLLRRGFAVRGLTAEQTDPGRASDHAPFQQAGIPVGGVSSGASEVKSAAQRDRYGGRAGRALDPCYHEACDTLRNVDLETLRELQAAVRSVLLRLVY